MWSKLQEVLSSVEDSISCRRSWAAPITAYDQDKQKEHLKAAQESRVKATQVSKQEQINHDSSMFFTISISFTWQKQITTVSDKDQVKTYHSSLLNDQTLLYLAEVWWLWLKETWNLHWFQILEEMEREFGISCPSDLPDDQYQADTLDVDKRDCDLRVTLQSHQEELERAQSRINQMEEEKVGDGLLSL